MLVVIMWICEFVINTICIDKCVTMIAIACIVDLRWFQRMSCWINGSRANINTSQIAGWTCMRTIYVESSQKPMIVVLPMKHHQHPNYCFMWLSIAITIHRNHQPKHQTMCHLNVHPNSSNHQFCITIIAVPITYHYTHNSTNTSNNQCSNSLPCARTNKRTLIVTMRYTNINRQFNRPTCMTNIFIFNYFVLANFMQKIK